MVFAASRVFHDEQAAYRLVEELVWPDGPVCPHCGSGRAGKMRGQSTRIGTYKCYGCRKPFTVKLGTLTESSHVPLHVWLKAIYLLSCSERHVSLTDLQRATGVTLKTAWFVADRIRKAVLQARLADRGQDGLLLEPIDAPSGGLDGPDGEPPQDGEEDEGRPGLDGSAGRGRWEEPE